MGAPFKEAVIALRATLVTLLLTGILYPFAVTGLAQVLFASRANGTMVTDAHNRIVGSELIAQSFTSAGYLHPRPSAAGDTGYDAANSGGSNLGPTSAKLRARVESDRARLAAENPDATGPVPTELLTTSASGLDPHLSPEAALWQVPRIAKARGLEPQRVRTVVESRIEDRDFMILGEPRVNVLLTNLELDTLFGRMETATGGKTPEGGAPR